MRHRQASRGGRVVVIAAIAIAILAVAVLLGVILLRSPSVSENEAGDIAAAFLEEVRTGQVDSAWQGTTAEFKSAMGKATFRRFVWSQPAFTRPLEFSRFEMTTVNSLPLAECIFNSPTTSKTVKVLLGREQDQWKVESLSVE